MHCHRRYLHYIPNVEEVEPFTLVQVAEDRFHVQLGLRRDLVADKGLEILYAT